MGVPHPIPYQGSKRALARDIITHFPVGTERVIEPFAGSAAVALAAAYYGKARSFLLNDLNQALMDLWNEIINSPESIASAYEELWKAQQGREREFYDIIRTEFNETHRPAHFLYLLARCVKASVRYNPSGEFNQSPDNRRKGARPDVMRSRITGASMLLGGRTELACADYRKVLADVTPLDIVYMDPPYQGVSESRNRRYIRALSFDGFTEVLQSLNEQRVSFIVSYDGRTGGKTFGKALPESLSLMRLEIDAGRSSQATLLGRTDSTVESLYLSPTLVERIGDIAVPTFRNRPHQYTLFTNAV